MGQPVWPIETKSGKQVLGRQGKVFSVELRIKVKFPGTPQPVDYHPRSLSRKGP
ncbi:MAG TPA: hypothetical protein VHD37_02360 [Candidatus Paceibacterota bacterium]|nr:hypothetical protein [Candidatus Paceibacterota bacterium]